MRLIFYLLSFYTISLSCIPCQDEIVMPSHDSYSAIANIKTNQNAEQQVVDLCSPFCICACCAGVTLQYATASLPALSYSLFPDEKSFRYIPHSGSGNTMMIWQPPRV
ncbi:DUF6660 family protein [Dyadobacter sp. NIV53]|uniref:DUF6660 family protein n=1 Tax=Dyadobacter sp. NIV53 TaxID=2861765 RepID=UPI001C86BF7B|nr:DUF6660 family protein [Dyadobacter sp. NIV53]